nr:MAG TPA: hypothetical protein [Caudoviricetes sp.]
MQRSVTVKSEKNSCLIQRHVSHCIRYSLQSANYGYQINAEP